MSMMQHSAVGAGRVSLWLATGIGRAAQSIRTKFRSHHAATRVWSGVPGTRKQILDADDKEDQRFLKSRRCTNDVDVRHRPPCQPRTIVDQCEVQRVACGTFRKCFCLPPRLSDQSMGRHRTQVVDQHVVVYRKMPTMDQKHVAAYLFNTGLRSSRCMADTTVPANIRVVSFIWLYTQ